MAVVRFYHQYRSHEIENGANLREAMMKLGLTPYKGLSMFSNCRGHNFCGTCAVEVVDGKGASPRSQDEEATLVGTLAIARKVEKSMRLACQTTITGDMVVKTHPVRTIDWPTTKERLGLLVVGSFFAIAFLAMCIYLVFDMIKKY